MTNAEKYLKDEVVYHDLACEIALYISNSLKSGLVQNIDDFFKEIVKPQLTEDEKVILRNLDKSNFEKIGRCGFSLYLKTHEGEEQCYISYMFHQLFQFIKKRRRIRN